MQLNKKPHQVSRFLKFQSEDNIASIILRITLLRVSSALQLPSPFSQYIIILVATSHGLLILTGVQSFEITIHADICYGPSVYAIRRGPLMLFKELSGKYPDLK